MKKFIYIFISICACFASQAQIQQEDFNATTIPTGWTATYPSGSCTWEFGFVGTAADPVPGTNPNPVTFPTGGVIFDDQECGSGFGNIAELEGPEIDLVEANVVSAAIEIIYNHQTIANDGDFLVEVWDGSAWQNVLTVDGDMPASNAGTTATATIDVTPYINDEFKVKFIYDDEFNPPSNNISLGVGIDNYQLLDTATASIDELTSAGFRYFPNPVIEDNLNLAANENISAIKVYNILGQKMIESKPNATTSKVRMANLPTGTYIVNVAIGEKKGSFKVLKQ